MHRGLCCLLLAALTRSSTGQPAPEEVTFPSGNLQLHGFLWRPAGAGPFPAILWNHGSERHPTAQPGLAGFYTGHGYLFFVPHRRGQGRSPGPYIQDQLAISPRYVRPERMIELQEIDNADVIAALAYLRSQPFVDPARIAISGCSYGGIQTLLAGEHPLGVVALIPFAPGAMSWERAPALQWRLRQAVVRATAPIFLLQAANDYSLGPAFELSREAERHHADFHAKVYPPQGTNRRAGHGEFCTAATDVWGNDVLAFLEAHMSTAR